MKVAAELRPALAVVLLLLLAACSERQALAPAPESAAFPAVGIHPYTGELVQCVPYARQITGIDLLGDAWTWWDGAAGKYERGHAPRRFAVLVLSRTHRLKLGHVAVVVDVESPRQIRVTHANFGSDNISRHVIYDSMPAIDVSPENDWTLVRFWNYQANAWGTLYAAYGFIYPEKAGAGATAWAQPRS
jgi:surface antigen